MHERPRFTDLVDQTMRQDWGRLLSILVRDLRDIQLAEDCLSEAFTRALDHWSRGCPENPQGWLIKTARRQAIDRIRRRKTFEAKVPDLTYLYELDQMDTEEAEAIPDERLRLIFTACHPALDEKTRLAMTLRTLCGLTTTEIARAFLDTEPAMAQRLVRAKQKIAKAGIPFAIPAPEDWAERLNSVLTVIYLIFNEGYAATGGELSIRADLSEEAIRLTRAIDELCPREPEILGLLALMLLGQARSAARFDPNGAFVPLDQQDRALWDQALAAEGLNIIEMALRRGRAGPFQLQAAISAIHIEAATAQDTNWPEIVLIYDRLLEMTPNPVVALNRAVAVSFAIGPAAGLAALPTGLESYQSFHAARADMYRRAGQNIAARTSYEKALKLTHTAAEHAFLQSRIEDLD